MRLVPLLSLALALSCGISEADVNLPADELSSESDALTSSDTDRDTVPNTADNCPTLANPNQADTDGDGVGDVCDNCVAKANGRVSLSLSPAISTTGGQRDDDADGFGNACDGDFDNDGRVTVTDIVTINGAPFQPFNAVTCGSGQTQRCAMFDLDEDLAVTVKDFYLVTPFTTPQPGPKCSSCGNLMALACAGPACPPLPCGDLTGDRRIDVSDMVKAHQCIYTPTGPGCERCDVDADRRCTVTDYMAIYRAIYGNTSGLRCAAP